MKINLKSSSLLEKEPELLVAPVAPLASDIMSADLPRNSRHSAGKRAAARKADISGPESGLQAFAPETREFIKQLVTESNGAFLRRLKKLDYKPTERFDLHAVISKRIVPIRLFSLSQDALSLKDSGIEEWRKLGGDAVRTALRSKVEEVRISLRAVSKPHLPSVIEAVVEGALLARYEFRRYKSESKEKKSPQYAQEIVLYLREKPSKAMLESLKAADSTAKAITFARDLVNTPALDMLPKDLVQASREIKKRVRRSKLKIYGPKELKRMKANLILAVSAGSESSPYLIHLNLPAKGKGNVKKVVLVGKGVAFDSGGLSIKPGKSMEDMKADMSGAAAVLGVFQAFTSLDLKGIDLHVIVPTTENSVSSGSIRPGDIVQSMNGKTVEILNTDAEGRLILADALTYCERIKPDIIIDLATLTGACVVALGDDYAGLFTDDEKLKSSLLGAAKSAGELLWPLPLAKEYQNQLRGEFGDLRNIGSGSGGGATIGALFLQEFVPEGAQWAHLDIAGPAFLHKSGDYTVPGGTGYGIRTLLEFLKTVG